jgi:maleamate amidohydrolase
MDLDRRSIDLGNCPALIVVDMMRGFTDPACPLGVACPDVVARNADLLSAMRKAALPIFFTSVVYDHAEQAKVFRARVPALNLLTPDSHWIEIDPALEPREGEINIIKHGASGFFGTDLNARLRAAKADSLIVTGLTTSGCVRATAVDGLQSDYPVIVVSDAVGDRNEAAHVANLHDLHAKYADVQTTAEVLTRLERG